MRRDAGRAESVAADQRFDAGRAAPDHWVHLRLRDAAFRELLRFAPGRAE